MRKTLIGALLLCPLISIAETGDYSVWDTLKHLSHPPAPDNPIKPEQTVGDYPLIANPQGFNDGFDPKRYGEWQTIQVAAETGAVCGNGSPYKFFVNRVPNTSNTIIYLEGGGACWDYESCSGAAGIRGARNPNGISDDYMEISNLSAAIASPFIVRWHPWSRVKTQNWNMVYVPYCTGDIYSGDKVAVYEDEQGEEEPLVWHHNGIRNTRAVVAWLKENMQRPSQLLATGCSAGGIGSLTNYYPLRSDLEPDKGFLIDDSGPAFPSPTEGDPAQYPSLPLQKTIRDAWGLDQENGPLEYLQARMPLFDENDLGTLYRAMATQLPEDRMGHTHFWEDLNYSSYSYERFYEELLNAPDQETLEAGLHEKWGTDTQNLIQELANLDNFGYYFPRFRDVNESHCTSIIEFQNSDIQEAGLELDDFINNVLEGQGPVMQASEADTQADHNKPFNPFYALLKEVL